MKLCFYKYLVTRCAYRLFTVLANTYSNGGDMEEPHKILAEAKKKHVKLRHVIFHTLIHGYCKLEQFHEALKLSAGARLWCRPSVDEYDKLIQSLCLKALDWEMAEKLQEKMKGSGLRLKGIMRGLIRVVKEMDKEVVEAESIVALAYRNLLVHLLDSSNQTPCDALQTQTTPFHFLL
ncbi:Pentatricopeptide repeat-containing protein, mitochondrial [Glycine max]|nr:Pentatricopeptide repeat-containing protein, mitochondrial [Glycine max]